MSIRCIVLVAVPFIGINSVSFVLWHYRDCRAASGGLHLGGIRSTRKSNVSPGVIFTSKPIAAFGTLRTEA